MVKADLLRLGEALIQEVDARRYGQLRACVYYGERPHTWGRHAIYLNAYGDKEFRIELMGPVPTQPTPQGCFDALNEYQKIKLETWRFDATDNTLIVSCPLMYKQVCMPAVVARTLDTHLPGNGSWPKPWGCIPNLRAVRLTITDSQRRKLVTLEIDTDAYGLAVRTCDKAYREAQGRFLDRDLEGARRFHAKLISRAELGDIEQASAEEEYETLLAPTWLRLYPSLKVEWHREVTTRFLPGLRF